ncbi:MULTISPECIES: hypothetical protein [Salimicrobium]|uniref:Uncharacterized protein n=2 Tax=Salimicrobium TaxID=351195 RepID=K2G7T0_9BACI|nr:MULTISPECIES: hypothetical protein [Salimicrobium]AKG05536.1 hypothetical protein AAV35_012770 [Salimicrobium jeotgali]EKE30472.1 hypothetical protein MJ3_13564 [Salimicrobium jeotgali]MBM7696620.1 hypothetical protein [Salimicrobium jeotgali]SDX62244.1 hypothetical protein SAMN04488081_0857 [Salimicrobium album]
MTKQDWIDVLSNLGEKSTFDYISLGVSIASPLLLLFSVIVSLKAAKASRDSVELSKEIFEKTQKAEEMKLLPLFELKRNHVFLNKGKLIMENPDPDKIMGIYFQNKNSSPITDVKAVASIEEKEEEIEHLIKAKNINEISYTTDGVVLNVLKGIELKEYKVQIVYRIQSNKMYETSIVVSVQENNYIFITEQQHTEL